MADDEPAPSQGAAGMPQPPVSATKPAPMISRSATPSAPKVYVRGATARRGLFGLPASPEEAQ